MERRRLLDNLQLDPSIVFYAPLVQGDTIDHISGSDVTVDSHASLSWNTVESAYLFTGNPGYDLRKTMFYWSVSLGLFTSSTTAANACYTATYKVKIKQAADTSMIRMASNINTNQITIGTNTWVKIAQVYSKYEGTPRYSYIYVDGQVGFSYDRGSTVATGNANTNIMMDVNKCFDSYSYGYTDCKFYMRNAMAFTAGLDIDTIKKIQNIQ